MHPVLLTLPLPGWPIPLGAAFVVLALAAAAVALLGHRGAARDLTVLGGLAGVLALGLALRFRGQTLRLESLPVVPATSRVRRRITPESGTHRT